MLLEPPQRRGSAKRTPTAPVRRKARTRNSKVTVSYVPTSEITKAVTPKPATITAEELYAYQLEGVESRKDALLLFHGKVPSADIDGWEAAGVKRDDYERMVYFASNGVTVQNYKEYPAMQDQDLLALVLNGGLTAEEAHEFGHILDICCGVRPLDSNGNRRNIRIYPPLYTGTWGHISEWKKKGKSPREVQKLYQFFDGDCARTNVFLMYNAPLALLDHIHCNCTTRHATTGVRYCSNLGRHTCKMTQVREVWKLWVEAAEGHVGVAKAVCESGWSITEIPAWLQTGETPERIALLARTGVDPYTLDQRPVAELSSEDLEIWIELRDTNWV